jgi:hypothetical protein
MQIGKSRCLVTSALFVFGGSYVFSSVISIEPERVVRWSEREILFALQSRSYKISLYVRNDKGVTYSAFYFSLPAYFSGTNNYDSNTK